MKECLSNTRTRIVYGDFIKAFGIILVVLGHINSYNGFLKEWIYSFCMPLFFFASGVIAANRKKEKSFDKKSLLSKIKSLLVPYIIWGLMYSGFSFYKVLMLGYGSYYSIKQAGSLSSLWFLPVMFVSVCIFELFNKADKTQNKNYFLVFLVLLFVIAVIMPNTYTGYPFGFDTALLATSFIIFGYISENFLKEKAKKNVILIAIIMIGFAITLLWKYNIVEGIGYVLMADMNIGNPVIFIVISSAGCWMVYGLARITETINVNFINKILSFLGKNTLVIFAVHKPLISVFEKSVIALAIPDTVKLFAVTIMVLVVTVPVCLMIDFFAPLLAGKNK